MTNGWNKAMWLVAAGALIACGDDLVVGEQSNAFQCIAGSMVPCTSCPDGRARATQCLPTGDALAECPCASAPLPMSGGAGGASGGVGGAAGAAGAAGTAGAMSGGMGGAAGMLSGGTGGGGGTTGGAGGSTGGAGGSTGGAGGSTGGAGGAGGSVSNPDDPHDEMRQLCLETINMYRATLSLEPLVRATPEQEMCSDAGAMMDADSGDAHGSAGMCQLGSQNTCPGYPVGGWGGGTLASSFMRCMQQMWDEGEPPVSREACQDDYAGCFLKHGHYLNMSDPRATAVGCGFYDMGDDTWWMNQNFAITWRR
jgi:hypothetical protein